MPVHLDLDGHSQRDPHLALAAHILGHVGEISPGQLKEKQFRSYRAGDRIGQGGVEGVYDSDPRKVPGAKRYQTVTFNDALKQDLAVMDATAFALCRDNEMGIIVFDMQTRGNVKRVVCGEPVGTTIVKDNLGTRFA